MHGKLRDWEILAEVNNSQEKDLLDGLDKTMVSQSRNQECAKKATQILQDFSSFS